MQETQTLTVDEQLPETDRRIDKIVRRLTKLSVRQAQGLFDSGGVKLNGDECKEPWKWLNIGDRVDVHYEPGTYYKAAPKPKKYAGFDLIFEDQHLLVVDKHAHVLTVPTEQAETDTLVHRVSDYLARGKRHLPKVWVVHRLDRGVSGLVVLAKQPEIATALRAQMAEHKPLRRYMAIVAGVVAQGEGLYESHLATDESLTRYSTDDVDEGERAVTHYRVIERLHDTTLVDVWLETGRRNQIRVHFAEAGHPVIGDQRYEPKKARHTAWEAKRLALVAVELGFTHPVKNEELRFQVPLVPEMTAFLKRARASAT